MESNQINPQKGKTSEDLIDCITRFDELSAKSDTFLLCDSNKSQNFIDLTKTLFNLNKKLIQKTISNDSKILSIKSSLNELFTTGFDEEQIWQQIQLNNEPLLRLLVKEVANVSVEGSYFTPEDQQNEEFSEEGHKNANKTIDESFEFNQITEEIEEESDDLMSEEESEDQNDDSEEKNKPKRVQFADEKRKSVVDDVFFKLHELEEFLNSEDLREERKISGDKEEAKDSDDDIDYFEDTSDLSGDEDLDEGFNGKEAMFNDFFDEPIDGKQSVEQQNNKSDEELDEINEVNDEIDTRDVDINDIQDNGDENNGINLDDYSSDESEEFVDKRPKDVSDENKSEFEKISETLKEKIGKQERLNLMTKSWQMSGEIVSDKRPENSLLEEHLHFDHTTRPAPLITEETTVKLEDIIRQRIKDNAYDNVVRKVKPKEKPFEYKRRITMESEKSKQSLAQIYENEYLKQQQNETETQQNPIHIQIKKMMRNLFVRMDALSNFNFTPRPPQPEVKIINNLPAITAEEVTPITVSDVTLLAPQEVFNNQKRELQSNTEKSETDRKRSRRIKKKIQSNKAKYDETNKKTKKMDKEPKIWSETKHLSSSKKFFEKLNEKNTEIVKKKKFEKKDSIKQSNKMKL